MNKVARIRKRKERKVKVTPKASASSLDQHMRLLCQLVDDFSPKANMIEYEISEFLRDFDQFREKLYVFTEAVSLHLAIVSGIENDPDSGSSERHGKQRRDAGVR